MSVRIPDIPAKARPRERLRELGLGSLSDIELVALVIRSGVKGGSALEIATELVATHGCLGSLADARLDDLTNFEGIGLGKASGLLAAFELGRRVASGSDQSQRIQGPEDVVAAVLPRVSEAGEELFVVSVSGGGRLLRVERSTVGTHDRCLIDPRSIIGAVLRHGGAAFALAHTHPHGDPEPSASDIQATRSVAKAAAANGLKFVDHVVIAGRRWRSLREVRKFDGRSCE